MALQYSTTGVFKYIGNPDRTSSVNSNLDVRYGPYNSLTDAIAATATSTDDFDPTITYQWRYKGMTVGIYNATGGVDEYWFKNGIADSDLIPKIPDISAILGNVKIVQFNANGGSGHMNSVLTDAGGFVHLPPCTFTNQSQFQGWGVTSGEASHLPGADVQVSQSLATFYAIWSDTASYTVSWTDGADYTITATANGTPIQSGSAIAAGSTVVFTCTPSQGYALDGWTGLPNNIFINGNTATVQSLSGNIIGASCNLVRVYTITLGQTLHGTLEVSVNGILQTGSQIQVEPNSYVTINYIATDSYEITAWNIVGAYASTNRTSASFIMPQGDVTVNPTESAIVEDIVITFYKDGQGAVQIGTTVTSQAPIILNNAISQSGASYTPPEGYVMNGWGLIGETTALNNDYEFMVPGTYSLYPIISLATYVITASAHPNEGGTTSGSGTYSYGDSVTLTASAANGYSFVSWELNGTQVSANATYTFTAVQGGTYIAKFEAVHPDQVTVIGLSGAAQYANTINTRIANDKISIATYQVTSGVETVEMAIPKGKEGDVNGFSVFVPQEYEVTSIKLFYSNHTEYSGSHTPSFGLTTSSTNPNKVTSFTYNGDSYDGYFRYQSNIGPAFVQFIVTRK